MSSAMRCPACGAPADAARDVCPSCDAPLPWRTDETRLADPDVTRQSGVAGNWRDPRVGRDIATGVVVGLAMTLVFAVHNLVPPLLGQPEPMPAVPDPTPLISVRYALARIFTQLQDAMTSAMLGLGGFVALRIWLKHRLLAAAIAVGLYVGVVMNGMFSPGSPATDLVVGLIITAAFVAVLGWAGQLTAIATLATHFILMRAPLTADVSSWRAPTGFVFVGAVLVTGLAGCYIAARGKGDSPLFLTSALENPKK